MQFLEAALVGIIVGLVIGALGAGGGIIAVPVLTYLLHQSPHAATSASLVIVAVTACLTLPSKAKRGEVRWRDGVIFGALSCVGAIVGRLINKHLDGKTLLILFAVLLLGVSGLMIRNALKKRFLENDRRRRIEKQARAAHAAATARGEDGAAASAAHAAAAKNAMEEESGEPRPLIWIILAATLTGFLTGLFGVGGGFAVVPVLILVMRFSVREATGTSLLVMIIAAVVSILTGVVVGSFHVAWGIVLLFIVGSTFGSHVGGRLSAQARPSTLALIFAFMVLAVGLFTFISTVVS